ncbi:MAG: hypothetical protein COA78_28445 [Blastopirellula sp.]|nr:MAG: hypothetical protein COA78_28445 [Blastopirellula sp.]
MDKVDILFVRACKTYANVTMIRLLSVRRRYYLSDVEEIDNIAQLVAKLSSIIDNNGRIPITAWTLMYNLRPKNAEMYVPAKILKRLQKDNPDHIVFYHQLGVLTSLIRFTNGSIWPKEIATCRHRKKESTSS